MSERYKKILAVTVTVIISLLVLGIAASLSATIFMLLFNWIVRLFGITFVLPFKISLVLMIVTALINIVTNKLAEFIKNKIKPYKE